MKSLQKLVCVLAILLFSDACIDRLDILSEGLNQGVLVVDGLITDQPGPYTVRLFKSSNNEAILNTPEPIVARHVSIVSDAGEEEILTTSGGGIYMTNPNGIRGQVGRKYHLRIELKDGTTYESLPEEILPVQKIDSVYYEWEESSPPNGPSEYGFRIFLDAAKSENLNSHIRWKFAGVYEAQTFPELNRRGNNCYNPEGKMEPPPPDPLPCSGFIYTGEQTRFSVGPGFLMRVSDCTCCTCWVTDTENKPKLNNEVISVEGEYRKIEMGYVPFEAFRFKKGKYMVTVEQMSLSTTAYEFWKVFQDQKEGATSLFQPAFGKARSNLTSTNSNREAIGIFYAAAVNKKTFFLTPSDAQIPVPVYDIEPPETNCALWRSCTEIFYNASYDPPQGWD